MSMTVAIALAWMELAAVPNVLRIPVDNLENWAQATYRGIPPNRVSIENSGIRIDIDRSASPLIYRFDELLRLTGFTVDAIWHGRLEVPAGANQGEDGTDDFVLKFGIVVAGDRRLNWFQRRVAADWVLQLYALAPEGSGISNIRFFSTTQQPELLGTSRTHPLSELLYEERILALQETGPFALSRTFKEPVEALGIWISSDGDDTGSKFQLSIRGIALTIVDD